MENISKILCFLNLFGYRLEQLDDNNWVIYNDKWQPIGKIIRKMISGENKKINKAAVYGLAIQVESSEISFSGVKIDDMPANDYAFTLKRNGEVDPVELTLGERPSIDIRSEEYGLITFRMDYNGMYLNYRSTTDSFKLDDTIHIKGEGEESKDYSFNRIFCYRNQSLDEKDKRSQCLIAEYRDYNEKPINLKQLFWKNGQLKKHEHESYDGTIAEVITINGMGIESFSHFRYLINTILPFKEEVLTSLLKDCSIPMSEIELFIPDIVEAKKTKVRNCNI